MIEFGGWYGVSWGGGLLFLLLFGWDWIGTAFVKHVLGMLAVLPVGRSFSRRRCSGFG
jgi:hypothetical protein